MLTEHNLTRGQVQILMALSFLLGGNNLLIRGSSIAWFLGGQWSSYRHNMMCALEKEGWVKCEKVGKAKHWRWYYGLTKEAHDYLVTLRNLKTENKTFEPVVTGLWDELAVQS